MLIDKARIHARGNAALHVHHVLLACADEVDAAAARILRESGWRSPPAADPADGETPRRLSPELILLLAWVNGLRTASGPDFDVNVAFLLGCVLGPTSVAHGWLQARGVDLDELCARSVRALGLPESTGERRRRWARDPVHIPAENVAAFTGDLRARGLKYMINVYGDGSAVVIPEESLRDLGR